MVLHSGYDSWIPQERFTHDGLAHQLVAVETDLKSVY
jgi:hypothetical protein